jgi:glycine/D-amino acid oxidase-like deaminating enzyme
MAETDVAVVGGGIAGCTLAFALAERGVKVTLLEAGRVGHQGASSLPVALLNPHRGRTARASDADLAGLAAMRELAEGLRARGFEPGVHFTGVLRLASNPKQAEAWRKLTGVMWLGPRDVPPPYHGPYGGFLVTSGGWVQPSTLLASLVQAAECKGARVVQRCLVTGLEPQADGVTLITSQGLFSARRVVLCTGAERWPSLALPPFERVAGDVVGLASGVDLPYPLAGAVYGAQWANTVWVGGNHRSADTSDPGAPAQLQRALGWFVKPLAKAERTGLWTGVRARSLDHEPVFRALQPGVYFLGALAGRGFLRAAALASQVAPALVEEVCAP